MPGVPFRIGVMQLTMEPLGEILGHARKHSMEARSATAISPLIARETERLTIGWGIISPFTRHPIEVAMDARVTQEAAGPERFHLGFGASRIFMKEIGADEVKPLNPTRDSTARPSAPTCQRSPTMPRRRAARSRSTSRGPARGCSNTRAKRPTAS